MEWDTVIYMAHGLQNGGTIPSGAALHNTWTADMPTKATCLHRKNAASMPKNA